MNAKKARSELVYLLMDVNPKLVALVLLVLAVSAGTFFMTREYSEANPPVSDARSATS